VLYRRQYSREQVGGFDQRANRLFASPLRQAEEMVSSFTVVEGPTLDGGRVKTLRLSVIAVKYPDWGTVSQRNRGW
jgi:hypothetical protein